MRFICIACESLARPVYACAARSPHVVDVKLIYRGAHQPEEIRKRLQNSIDAVDGQGYNAVLLAYGLCGQTAAGLTARSIPLIIPRAHDCITLYLGSRLRYQQEIEKEPGTYWYSLDYIERQTYASSDLMMGQSGETNMRILYEIYQEKYGKAKADKLIEVMNKMLSNYRRAVFLDIHTRDDGHVETQARQEAAKRGWVFEKMDADLTLLCNLLDGAWDEDFLVVPPGKSIVFSYDADIMKTR